MERKSLDTPLIKLHSVIREMRCFPNYIVNIALTNHLYESGDIEENETVVRCQFTIGTYC